MGVFTEIVVMFTCFYEVWEYYLICALGKHKFYGMKEWKGFCTSPKRSKNVLSDRQNEKGQKGPYRNKTV